MTKMKTVLTNAVEVIHGESNIRFGQFTDEPVWYRNWRAFKRNPVMVRHERHMVRRAEQPSGTDQVVRIPNVICVKEREPITRRGFDAEVTCSCGVVSATSAEPHGHAAAFDLHQSIVR